MLIFNRQLYYSPHFTVSTIRLGARVFDTLQVILISLEKRKKYIFTPSSLSESSHRTSTCFCVNRLVIYFAVISQLPCLKVCRWLDAGTPMICGPYFFLMEDIKLVPTLTLLIPITPVYHRCKYVLSSLAP